MERPNEYTRRELSGRLLMAAIGVTFLVSAFGSAVLWNLYQSYRDTLVPPRPEVVDMQEDPLVIGIARTPGGPSEWSAYARIFAQLQRDIERPVLLRYTLSRSECRRLLAEGKVDLALVATQDYFDVKNRADIRLVAAPIIAGQPSDAAVLVVRHKGPFTSVDELAGSRILLAEDLAGASYATWLFDQRDQEIDRFFGVVEIGGAQDANLTSVANGRADATCVRRSALATWPEGTFRVLAESPEFGTPPLVARGGLERVVIQRIQKSVTSRTARASLPPGSKIDGFSVPSEEDYLFARELERTRNNLAAASEGKVPK